MQHARQRIAITTCCAAVLVLTVHAFGDEAVTNSVGMRLVPIAPGHFEMGSDLGRDYWDEWPKHNVTIAQPFLIAEAEVTIEQFQAFRPDYEPTPDFEPYAAGVSWTDAVAYCEWLSAQEGKPYRLPTEAEWEYACRAGTTTLYSSGTQPPPHGQPNAWGIRNMHTGVREWCLDWYGDYPDGDQVDPVGPASGVARVVRGGLLDDGGRNAERTVFNASSSRASMAPDFGPCPNPPGAGPSTVANGEKTGLIGTWYSAADLTRPQQRDVITRLDNNWINDIARGGSWSARWRGLLKGPHSGEVTVQLSASSGAKLRIGDQDLIDAWEAGGTHTAKVTMAAGETYPIELHYARRGTPETFLKVLWSWPGKGRHVIDETWLTYTDRDFELAVSDGGIAPMRAGFHNIGFRVVQAPPPKGRPRAPSRFFAMRGVRQNTELAKIGPSSERPYFRKRFLLPVPLDNSESGEIDAVGMHTSFRGHNHSPALEVCPNGDVLLVIYTSYQEYEPGVSFIASRLRFGADQWDMPDRFVDFAGVNDHAPLLWTDHNGGTMYLFWGCPRLAGGFPFQWMSSTDNGATWSQVRFPRFEGAIGPHSRQPINTAFRNTEGTLFIPSDGDGGRSVLWATGNDGDTWYDTGGRSAGRHTTYALLSDGHTILGLGGKNTDIDGYMPRVISPDAGRTWDVSRTPLPAQGTNQRPSVLRLQSGRLLCAGDFQHFRGHKPEAIHDSGSFVALSVDDGETWTFRKLPGAQPHEDPQWHGGAATLGYSALRQAPNGMIHLIGTMTRPCLHFEFNEAWVLNGLDTRANAMSDEKLMASGATSVPETAAYTEQYGDGAVRLEYHGGVADDGRFLLHGPVVWRYPNGQVQYEARYRLGCKVGTETYWSEAGQKLWEWAHEAGGTSTWTQWWPAGGRRATSDWKGLRCHGAAKLWDRAGRPVQTAQFANGRTTE